MNVNNKTNNYYNFSLVKIIIKLQHLLIEKKNNIYFNVGIVTKEKTLTHFPKQKNHFLHFFKFKLFLRFFFYEHFLFELKAISLSVQGVISSFL